MKPTISKILVIENFKLMNLYVILFFIVALFLPSSIFSQVKKDSVQISQEQLDDYKKLKKAAKAAKVEKNAKADKSGNDPRVFSNKWTPFYRNTKLENGLVQQDVTASGTIAFGDYVGLIYEIPVAQHINIKDVEGVPEDFPKSVIGIGDISLKFLIRPKFLDFKYGKPGKMNKKSGSIVIGTDFVLPTSTNTEFGGGNSFKLAPILGLVIDTPMYGFFAMINLYYFDVYKTEAAPKTSMYVGRWFYMQPLTPPGKWWGLFFLMPEFQPIYNFETNDFSSWLGLEFVKVITDGQVAYIKPGWGLGSLEPTDRRTTFEFGWRYFF